MTKRLFNIRPDSIGQTFKPQIYTPTKHKLVWIFVCMSALGLLVYVGVDPQPGDQQYLYGLLIRWTSLSVCILVCMAVLLMAFFDLPKLLIEDSGLTLFMLHRVKHYDWSSIGHFHIHTVVLAGHNQFWACAFNAENHKRALKTGEIPTEKTADIKIPLSPYLPMESSFTSSDPRSSAAKIVNTLNAWREHFAPMRTDVQHERPDAKRGIKENITIISTARTMFMLCVLFAFANLLWKYLTH